MGITCICISCTEYPDQRTRSFIFIDGCRRKCDGRWRLIEVVYSDGKQSFCFSTVAIISQYGHFITRPGLKIKYLSHIQGIVCNGESSIIRSTIFQTKSGLSSASILVIGAKVSYLVPHCRVFINCADTQCQVSGCFVHIIGRKQK